MVLKKNTNKACGKKEKTEESDSPNTPETTDPQTCDEAGNPEIKDAHTEISDQLNAEKERVARLSAEFENFKKRRQREIDDFKKFANETVFRQLLSVVDNLERAIDSATDAAAETSLLEGVRLTHKELLKLFESFNVKPVMPENQAFDPNFHQAVTHAQNNDVPDNTVINVLQKGYLLHDRLLRPAMVVVSKRVDAEACDIVTEE